MIWSYSFGVREPDFSAEEDGQPVGRVFLMQHGYLVGKWIWSATGVHSWDPEKGALYGEVGTKREAVEALREAWEQAKRWSAANRSPLWTWGPVYLPPWPGSPEI